jgi:hypothetical protein
MQHTLPSANGAGLDLGVAPVALPAEPHAHGGHAHAHGASARFDRLGAALGFLCAVHCVAVPLLMGVLPSLGLEFLADGAVDAVIVVVATLFAGVASVLGFRQHGERRVVAGFAGAVALLVAAQFFGEENLAGRAVSIAGGLTLAVTHLVNMRLGRRCAH